MTRRSIYSGMMTPQAKRREMGYDAQPPRCSDCDHHRLERKDTIFPPEKLIGGGKVRVCQIGGFIVTAQACCDLWSGKGGREVLA